MVRFYRHLQDGVPATAALRHAKIEMQATLPHPFFWAPFVLIGRT
jgi:CHAT domain-containing protein